MGSKKVRGSELYNTPLDLVVANNFFNRSGRDSDSPVTRACHLATQGQYDAAYSLLAEAQNNVDTLAEGKNGAVLSTTFVYLDMAIVGFLLEEQDPGRLDRQLVSAQAFIAASDYSCMAGSLLYAQINMRWFSQRDPGWNLASQFVNCAHSIYVSREHITPPIYRTFMNCLYIDGYRRRSANDFGISDWLKQADADTQEEITKMGIKKITDSQVDTPWYCEKLDPRILLTAC